MLQDFSLFEYLCSSFAHSGELFYSVALTEFLIEFFGFVSHEVVFCVCHFLSLYLCLLSHYTYYHMLSTKGQQLICLFDIFFKVNPALITVKPDAVNHRLT